MYIVYRYIQWVYNAVNQTKSHPRDQKKKQNIISLNVLFLDICLAAPVLANRCFWPMWTGQRRTLAADMLDMPDISQVT